MKTTTIRLSAVAAIVCSLSACSGLVERVENDAANNADRGKRLAQNTGKIERTGPHAQAVVFEKGIFIGKTANKLPVEKKLPAVFSEPAWFDRSVGSLQEFAERISTRSGVPTKVGADATQVAIRAQSAGGATIGQSPMGAMAPGLPPVPSAIPTMQGATGGQYGQGIVQPVRITYSSGDLKGLLDAAVARFGVSWKYEDGVVKFFHMESKTYSIRAVPGDASLNATVGSQTGNNGTSSGGGSSSSLGGTSSGTSQVSTSNAQSTQVTSSLSVWKGMQDSIGAMLSPGGKVVSSPATGTITVTETPDVLARVTEFVETQNALIGKQVMINATILRVANTEKENFGISWSLVWKDLQNKYGVTNKFTPDTGGSSFSGAIISPTSKWTGSSIVIDALSQQGTVNLETSASVTALNNQPTPIQVASQTTYLASSSTTTVPNAGTTTAITPGTVSSGFTMTILPSVMQDGSIIMQFQSDISALKNIRTITSGTASIEAPELDTRNFLQRVTMKSGETLIISGFEQTDGNINRSGVASPNNWILGGGRKGSYGKEVMVILLTPIVL